jgi:hypothetical protein
MSGIPSYSDNLAREILTPKSLIVVTGDMGSGMTDFTLRMLQFFKGRIFSTEHLPEPPPNYQRVWLLSQVLTGVALEAQSRLPFAVYVDHAGILSYRTKRAVIARQHLWFKWLVKAVQQTEGTLILSGSRLDSDLPSYVLEGWDHVLICQKSVNRTKVFITSPGNPTASTWYANIPRTTWQYNTRDMSVLTMDIDPKKLAQFFTDLSKEMRR